MEAFLLQKLTTQYSQPRNRLKVLISTEAWALFVMIVGGVFLGVYGRDLPLYSDGAIAVTMFIVSLAGYRLWDEYARLNPLFQAAPDQTTLEQLTENYWDALRIVWITTIPITLLYFGLGMAGKEIHRLAAR